MACSDKSPYGSRVPGMASFFEVIVISAESKCDLDDGQQRFNDSSMARKQHHGRLVQLDTTDMYNADTT